MKPARIAAAALVVALVSGTAVAIGATRGGGDAPAQATVVMRYSQFTSGGITARAGEPIRITIRNDDPIEHEWIVGTEAVHERHRAGTEPFHDEIPTEVTVPALSTKVTTTVFHEPGVYTFICHLPGHEAYGMTGELRVLPR